MTIAPDSHATSEGTSKPTCFVLMPISDVSGYESGHFARVYEHLLRPAIERAGFEAMRADDEVKTDYIVVSIIRRIVEASMVVCDLSARNPNVMYELGIRHAFNKPVALIKDRRTEKVFDIQGLRYAEYDETLRIDTVQADIKRISGAIAETSKANADSMNSVVQLAGIKAAEVPAAQIVSPDTNLILAAIGSLDSRLASLETDRVASRAFRVEEDRVIFTDGTTARIGNYVVDAANNNLGELVDIHPSDEKIFLKHQSGRIVPFASRSVKARGLSALPF